MDWVWALPKLNSIPMGGRMENLLSIDNFNRLDQVGSVLVETEKGGVNHDFKGKQRRFSGNLTRSGKISKQIETSQIWWKTH